MKHRQQKENRENRARDIEDIVRTSNIGVVLSRRIV